MKGIVLGALFLCMAKVTAQGQVYSNISLTASQDQIRFTPSGGYSYFLMSKPSASTALGLYSPDNGLWYWRFAETTGDLIMDKGKIIVNDGVQSQIKIIGSQGSASWRARLYLDRTNDIRGAGVWISSSGGSENDWYAGVPYGGNGYTIGYHASKPEYTDNSSFFIKSDGNVGIGTTSPSARFQVVGDGIRALRYSVANINDRINDSPWYGVGLTDLTDLSSSNNDLAVQVAGYYGLLMKIAYGEIAMLQNGKVGIGTNDPGSYKLAVEGKIGAREIVVTTDDPWPDYVFTSTYQLSSLKDIECYINQNHHLPDMPSAKEVKENGVSLGEMNAKLLEKVEELTLYLIHQNNISKTQSKIINELRNQNETLNRQYKQLGEKLEQLEKE